MPTHTTCDDCITEMAYTKLLRPEVEARLGGPTVLLCRSCIEVRLKRVLRKEDHLHAV